MIFHNENCLFSFRLFLLVFFLAVHISTEAASDGDIKCGEYKEIIAGDSNEVQKDLLKLFDRPLRMDTNPPVKKKAIFGLTKSKVPSFHDAEPGAKPDPLIERHLVNEIITFGLHKFFSPMITKHGRIAANLVKIFMKARNIDDLLSIATAYRQHVNPGMFNYALSVALMNRNDTSDLRLPAHSQLFPDMYINQESIAAIKAGNKNTIASYPNGMDADEENHIAYFRQDICVNLHHWNWHQAYPFSGGRKLTDKDRRGELFYYMHHQILARYNAERLSNRLTRVDKLNNFAEPIEEAYDPEIRSELSSTSFASRAGHSFLKDIYRPDHELEFDIADLKFSADRIYEAIYTGAVLDKHGNPIPLTEEKGIDVIGDIVEASPDLSPNFRYYGNIHNNGHMAIAYIHDPHNLRNKDDAGVMSSTATAMRDPVFYRWHAYINDIFAHWKNGLKPYTQEQLNFPGIEVYDVQVVSQTGQVNILETFMNQSTIDISRGLDFEKLNPSITVTFDHLNHTSYKYRFTVMNNFAKDLTGTVRIFIAPSIDDRGLPFSLHEQKDFMIDMDTFSIKLKPGQNIIERESSDSSVTVPFYTDSTQLDDDVIPALEQFNGCGWPDHMLLPKGTDGGFPMDLFIMISNDKYTSIPRDKITGLKNAPNLCGLRNQKYPDVRAMGYPFDRQPPEYIKYLSDLVNNTHNMAMTQIKVKFVEKNE